MSKVFIGVGHGGSDPGAMKYVVEKDVNLKVAKACNNYLTSAGIQVMMSRETDIDETLVDKINRCNDFKPDVALDIHNNAGGGKGFELYHSIVGGTGKTLAKNIETEVLKIGQNSRGLKIKTNASGTDFFGFIRETACPSVICEGAFVDNEKDVRMIDSDSKCVEFGQAYARGIIATLGISHEQKNTTAKPKLYRVQVGAFADKENAEKLQTTLKSMGYDCFVN